MSAQRFWAEEDALAEKYETELDITTSDAQGMAMTAMRSKYGEAYEHESVVNAFKTKGYDFQRNTEHSYTYAVIYRNLLWAGPGTNVGATFHTTENLARQNAVALSRRSHLEVVEIVEVERI